MAFVSFALGVSLILTGGLSLLSRTARQAGRRQLQGAFAQDWRDTDQFRQYMENRMERLLAMAMGGPLYGDAYIFGEITETDVVTSIALSEGGYELYTPSEDPAPTQKERWKEEIEAYEKAIHGDQNVLYRVTVDGKLLYSNTDFHLKTAPSGYGFLMYYQDGKCTAYRDGQEINLYNGDVDSGVIYTGGDPMQWLLPGYINYPAGDSLSGVRISIAVADTPVSYFSPTQSSWHSGDLYYLVRELERTRADTIRQLWVMGAGLLLLLVSLLLRKDKLRADRALAGATGHLWFEVKLLFPLFSLVLLSLILSNTGMTTELTEIAYAYDGQAFLLSPTYWSVVFSNLLDSPVWLGALLLLFWSLYLFCNDLRYGDKPWRHGVCGMLLARELALPIQKRLIRRRGWLALALLLLGSELVCFLIVATVRRLFPAWAIWNLFLLPLLFALAVYLLQLRHTQALARDIGALAGQIEAVGRGEMEKTLALPEDSDLYLSAQQLGDIQQGMVQAVEERTRSERMKVELITNVSHDLKTPLTSIISYAELLKQEALAPPAGEYVEILSQKAERLRAMVLDIFEVSKAASGQLPVKPERLDLGKLLQQTMADMQPHIDAAPVSLRPSIPEEPVFITADGDRLYRVFQNLLQNALQYALEGSRVYLSLAVEDGRAVVSVKNTSKTELPADVDFTARFVRGDASRTDGGSGLGLAIAQSFTEACGGTLTLAPVADLFVVTVTFPLTETP